MLDRAKASVNLLLRDMERSTQRLVGVGTKPESDWASRLAIGLSSAKHHPVIINFPAKRWMLSELRRFWR